MPISLTDFSFPQSCPSQGVRIKNGKVGLSQKSSIARFLIRIRNSMLTCIPWVYRKKRAEQQQNRETAAALMQALTTVYGSAVKLSENARAHDNLMNGTQPLTVHDINTITTRIATNARYAKFLLYCQKHNINDDISIRALSGWVSPEYQHVSLDDWKKTYDAIASGTLAGRLTELFTAFTESLVFGEPYKNMLTALCHFSDCMESAAALQQGKIDYVLLQVIRNGQAETLLDNLMLHPWAQELMAASAALTAGQDTESRHIKQIIKTLVDIFNACATGLESSRQQGTRHWLAHYRGMNHHSDVIDNQFSADLYKVLASAQTCESLKNTPLDEGILLSDIQIASSLSYDSHMIIQ